MPAHATGAMRQVVLLGHQRKPICPIGTTQAHLPGSGWTHSTKQEDKRDFLRQIQDLLRDRHHHSEL